MKTNKEVKIESVLALVGAEVAGGDTYLRRIGYHIYTDLTHKATQWLLIGEITEALREKDYRDFRHTEFEENGWALRGPGKGYSGDSLLSCYLQAATELLRGEEVI